MLHSQLSKNESGASLNNPIMKQFILKYKKPIIITISITVLQLVFGFDPKFTIINIIWLFV